MKLLRAEYYSKKDSVAAGRVRLIHSGAFVPTRRERKAKCTSLGGNVFTAFAESSTGISSYCDIVVWHPPWE